MHSAGFGFLPVGFLEGYVRVAMSRYAQLAKLVDLLHIMSGRHAGASREGAFRQQMAGTDSTFLAIKVAHSRESTEYFLRAQVSTQSEFRKPRMALGRPFSANQVGVGLELGARHGPVCSRLVMIP